MNFCRIYCDIGDCSEWVAVAAVDHSPFSSQCVVFMFSAAKWVVTGESDSVKPSAFKSERIVFLLVQNLILSHAANVKGLLFDSVSEEKARLQHWYKCTPGLVVVLYFASLRDWLYIKFCEAAKKWKIEEINEKIMLLIDWKLKEIITN